MIFRLATPVVTKPPRVRGTAQEYFEPCLPGDAPAFTYPDSCQASLTILPPEPQIGVTPLPEVQTCPRPRSPTPKKASPPPPPPRRPSPEYVRPPRRLSTVYPLLSFLRGTFLTPFFSGVSLATSSYDAHPNSASPTHLQDQVLHLDGIVHACQAGL